MKKNASDLMGKDGFPPTLATSGDINALMLKSLQCLADCVQIIKHEGRFNDGTVADVLLEAERQILACRSFLYGRSWAQAAPTHCPECGAVGMLMWIDAGAVRASCSACPTTWAVAGLPPTPYGERLEATLRAIAMSPHCSYDTVGHEATSIVGQTCESCGDSQYSIGVVDGHRCAAKMARRALGEVVPE